MSAPDPIFCGVGLGRTPLLTRVRVLPWQKDTLRGVHEVRGGKEGEQEKKDKEKESEKGNPARTTRVARCRRGGGCLSAKRMSGLG